MVLFSAVWLCIHLFMAVEGNTEYHPHPLSVSVPHASYICPEGANVTLVCEQSGALDHQKDRMHRAWLFTQHMDQRCHKSLHVKDSSSVVYSAHARSFSITLLGVTHANQGRYCCMALDILQEGKDKPHVQQEAHSHMMLTITPRRNDSLNCTLLPGTPPPQSLSKSLAAGAAVAVVFVSLMCLPVLLVLVYRQRQRTRSNRRAHELVRMDSEAQGHENPVYMSGPLKTSSRTLVQILTRQTSDSGRHLLSDPGTPYSPNPQGDVFFPAHEPIPEVPDIQPL
ncbi:V-type immunoglobulin domain-containing suppressor of T-cell activation isoform X2 [Tachysurus fulvidraco]|uniref:V-type immunoglobulin domain-containing suppressor of T-cell activation isoform X2 n=1 Tax=Tachysurus fulvidraco TaxID=1234273 RepID=UPI000F4EC08F|nr:V-type immunoglobulin domain-containing suppressor of T-cell activation isoform X2 [Tachysurus fulvidraco]